MFQKICFFILFSTLISGCSYEEMAEKFIPKAESSFAKEILEKTRQGDISAIKESFHPKLLEKADEASLNKLVTYFPEGSPISIEIIGSQTTTFEDSWSGNFTFEYQFEKGWAIAAINLVKEKEGALLINGIHIYRTEKSQKEIHAFSLSNKSFVHYLILASAVAVPIFIVVTLIYAIRTPIPQKKWLWIIFILLGVGSVSLNWSSSQFSVQPISIQLLGASTFSAGPYSPWIIGVSIPLGAIMFWFKRKKFLATKMANK